VTAAAMSTDASAAPNSATGGAPVNTAGAAAGAAGVRTRFAPSPTGFFHIGSARTALFNWLYARHTGGTFVLRVEDTDTARNSDEFLQIIYKSLRWLGMDWDEGPDGAGGAFGPYKQSERGEIYRDFLAKLRASGRAYERDGAVWLRLEGERRTIRETFKDDAGNKLDRVVEKVAAAPVVIHDLIRGDVTRAEDRDFVLVRANGEPGFHFVNVVDDITMGITHVIRGEDHLSNTSKHIELYNALGATPPTFAHIPLILKSDGKGKMSKRDRGALIEEYQQRHFLPDAVRNYLCLLGWTPKDGREILPIADIIEQFDLRDVHQGNARFDERKMAHFNQQYLKELPAAEFDTKARQILADAGLTGSGAAGGTAGTAECCAARLRAEPSTGAAGTAGEDYTAAVLALVREKLRGLEDLPAQTAYFFRDDYPRDPKALEALRKKPGAADRARQLLAFLETAGTDWNADPAAFDAALDTAVNSLLSEANAAAGATSFAAGSGEAAGSSRAAGVHAGTPATAAAAGTFKLNDYYAPLRYAVTGLGGGPHIHAILRLLGRERSLARLRAFIAEFQK
jgi:glutamyl-tRNA synthetase